MCIVGFISAVNELGRREMRLNSEDALADVSSFTQMPTEIIEVSDEKKAKRLPGQEIHIFLDAAETQDGPLEVRGIKRIELADFWAGDGDARQKKNRYLYRDPVSPAAAWRFSPVYKLGKGSANGRQEFLGDKDWRKDKNSRFYKLYNAMLLAFEERDVFARGSVERLMAALEERVDELAEKWSDKNRSYLLIFGLSDNEDHFLYPAEIPVFLEHFRLRLAEAIAPQAGGGRGRKKNNVVHCGLCHSETEAPVNLDKVFAFATFDKKSFLPGVNDSDSSLAKVFPICPDCFRFLSEGRNIIDGKFLDTRSIYGVRIYTVPELIIGNYDPDKLERDTKDFLKNGLQQEEFLGPRVLRKNDGLVYHFVFWEKNQAQERLLLMIEDVPPTRLRRLSDLWKQTAARMPFFRRSDDSDPEDKVEKATLWQAVNVIRRVLLDLGGKNEGDVNVLKDWLLGLLGRLLRGEQVDVRRVKELIVSRLQGRCADGEWVRQYSAASARDWNVIVDFLYRVNNAENAEAEQNRKGD